MKTAKIMTEKEIKSLGFKLNKQYNHGKFHTKRYIKGVLEVEFNYKDNNLVNCDLTISELNCLPITFDEMKVITPILGKQNI